MTAVPKDSTINSYAPLAIRTEVVTITPAIAREWLEKNTHNRNPSERLRVPRYTGAILRGEWVVTGEGIIFGKSGRLLDGQTRLMSVIAADRSIDSLVVWGVNDEAQTRMDQGKSRTIGDVLGLKGISNGNNIGAMARHVMIYEQFGSLDHAARIRSNTAFTIESIVQVVIEREQLFRDALKIGSKIASQLPGGSKSLYGALYLLSSDHDYEKAEQFSHQIITGSSDENAPANVLRNSILRETMRARTFSIDSTILSAWWIKSFNAHQAGRAIHILRWSPKNERFPKFS